MIVETGFYIVQYRHPLKQTDILKGPGNSCFIDFNRFLSCNVLAVQPDNALSRLIYAGQKVKYSRFTRAVGPDQAVELPFFNMNFKIIHSPETAE